MKHLSLLTDTRLVLIERRGRERWNFLNVVPLQQVYERWISPYQSLWGASLLTLKRKVEEEGGSSSMTEAAEGMGDIRSMRIEQEVEINGTPARVFEAITQEVAAWWGTPYHIRKSPKSLTIEARLGGDFVEWWGDGEGVIWAKVTAIRRNEFLQLTGAIGMSGAVQGVVALTLEPRGNATSLRLSHTLIGLINEDTRTRFSLGWKDLLGIRLKTYVETGEQYGLGREPPPGIPFDQPPC